MAVMQFDIVKNYTPTESQLLAEVGDADVVVFVGGISPSLEGEEMKVSEPGFKGGDRTDIELPQAQRKVMEMLHRALFTRERLRVFRLQFPETSLPS